MVKIYNGSRFGTGVVVTANAILTAWHVVDPDGAAAAGVPVDPSTLRFQGRFSTGLPGVDAISLPAAPGVDLALLHLHAPKRIDDAFRCPVRQYPQDWVTVGDEVTLLGFSDAQGDVQELRRRIVEVDGSTGAYVCDHQVPPGFSGGAALSDGALVGITFARHHDKGQTLFTGGKHLRDMLARLDPDALDWDSETSHPLRRYPLGPAVFPAQSLGRLNALIENCAQLFWGDAASRIIGKAIAQRIECGPDTGSGGLLEIHELPEPRPPSYGFWQEAVRIAGLKSPRMLAALLLAVDDVNISPQAAAQKRALLPLLENWGKRAR